MFYRSVMLSAARRRRSAGSGAVLNASAGICLAAVLGLGAMHGRGSPSSSNREDHADRYLRSVQMPTFEHEYLAGT